MKKNRLNKDKKLIKPKEYGIAESAKFIENMQYSKYHTKGGHGFAAEDANAFSDKIRLKNVDITGTSNELNGPDRIVDGVKIQTKYYKTPRDTINSAFDASTGLYRYKNQILEVPADQYDECLELMKKKILEGKVPGITDPKDAEKIIKKGKVTYKQAVNIAKAGNIDSIIFDIKTQSVVSTYVFGISFAIAYGQARWRGYDNKDALKAAFQVAIETAGATLISGVITSQILRTKSAAIATVYVRNGVKLAYKTSIGKSFIESLAKASLGKPVYGAAAINHVSKLLRSNVVISTISVAVTTTPDLYRAAIKKNISWKQFTKNLVVNISSVAGGVSGWAVGASIGATIGSVFPGPGTAIGSFIGGLAGAIAGGSISGKVSKSVADKFAKDDAEEMLELLEEVVGQIAFDYLLTEEEVKIFSEKIKETVSISFLRDMYKYGKGKASKCKEFAYKNLSKIAEDIISSREKISIPSGEEVLMLLEDILEEDKEYATPNKL